MSKHIDIMDRNTLDDMQAWRQQELAKLAKREADHRKWFVGEMQRYDRQNRIVMSILGLSILAAASLVVLGALATL